MIRLPVIRPWEPPIWGYYYVGSPNPKDMPSLLRVELQQGDQLPNKFPHTCPPHRWWGWRRGRVEYQAIGAYLEFEIWQLEFSPERALLKMREEMVKKLIMIIDEDLCWGCDTCELVCKQENNPSEGSRWIRVITKGVQKIDGRLKLTYSPARCLHCSKPPCKEVCQVNAISQRPDGIVLINQDACIGCKACIEACPFGVMQFNKEKGFAEKCHLCYHRIDRGEKPACVDVCPGRCIYLSLIHISEPRD